MANDAFRVWERKLVQNSSNKEKPPNMPESSASLKTAFDEAVKLAQSRPAKGSRSLTNKEKLLFYALYKQATCGPCTEKQPSRLEVVKYYKWKTWTALGKMAKDDAMKRYVEEATKIRSKL